MITELPTKGRPDQTASKRIIIIIQGRTIQRSLKLEKKKNKYLSLSLMPSQRSSYVVNSSVHLDSTGFREIPT